MRLTSAIDLGLGDDDRVSVQRGTLQPGKANCDSFDLGLAAFIC
jgi:hypothetical protein